MRRLNQLKSRLQKEPSMFKEYDDIFKTQLDSGIIEPVPSSELNLTPCYFLGVVRADRDTTMLTTVFDCSAKADSKLFS